MSGQIIIGNKLPPFSWLPNYLVNDPDVSADALAVALYLNGKPAGWQVRPEDIKNRFKFGDHTWRKVSRQLKACNLLHEKITKNGTKLWFEIPESDIVARKKPTVEKPTVENRGPRKAERGKSTPLDHKDHNKKDLYEDHKDHEGYEFLKENKATAAARKKPTMKQRETHLNTDGYYIFHKLLGYRGIFPGVAMAIVERHSVGDINNLIESAMRDGVRNPGAYVVKSLYKKEA